jgi:signal transduction histidine kinase
VIRDLIRSIVMSSDDVAVGSETRLHAGDPDRVARDLFEWSNRLVGIDGAILFALDGERLLPSHSFEIPSRLIEGLEIDLGAEGPVQRALRQGIAEVTSGPIQLSAHLSTTTPWATSVAVPLTIEDTRIGVFLAGWSAPYDIGREATLVLEGAAAMGASAIYGARLLHAVKREQQRLRLLLDRLPIPAIQFSEPEFVMTHLNEQARRLFSDVQGSTIAEVMSRLEVVPVEGPPISAVDVEQRLIDSFPTRRFRVVTVDGFTHTLHPHVARFGTGGGVIMLVDVTIEASLEAQRQRFVRMVSHHLRTPLTPLVGYAELLRSGDGDEASVRHATDEISNAAAEILGQVNRLEQISNLQPVDRGSLLLVPVGKLVAGAWSGAAGNPNDLEMVGDLDSMVWCAPEHIITAMGEIVANAYVHGKPPVRVSTVELGDWVRVEFEDAGPGIAEDWASAVFTPYVDANTGYAPPTPGRLGLGLPLARGLTEASHGDLTYEDGRFVFRLPATNETD